jgi:hypothetical protein
MIPHIEDILIGELERRIVEALPGTAPNPNQEPETFTTTFESRKVVPCIQIQENASIFATVAAEISVVFYSQRERYDYSPLYVSFARNPYIKLAEGVSAAIVMDRCEAVEGPYLSNDAWLVKAEYYIFEVVDGQEWQSPRLGNTGTSAPDLYPRPKPDLRDEPEAHI